MQPSELTPTQLLGIFAKFFELHKIPYRVVGSMASMAYGEPRLTIDVDIVAEVELQHIPAISVAFPSPDYYVSESATSEAIQRRSQFNVIHIPSGLKVDIIVPHATEFTRNEQSRVRRLYHGDDFSALYAAPEDVILNKLIYFQLSGGVSQKHVRDIGGMLKISPHEIDLDYIRKWAVRLNVVHEWELVLVKITETL